MRTLEHPLALARLALKSQIGLAIASIVGVFFGTILIRTAGYETIEIANEPAAELSVPAGVAERLAGALRFPTISNGDPRRFDANAFQRLHTYLQESFPRVHENLRRETINTHTLLYTWEGSDPSLAPILLMGHLDVVPVEKGTETEWEQPPFSGRIVDGFIWGRGAIDNKATVVGALEAVEMLLSEGFGPARTIYLAFGHDEEVGGTRGAKQVAALLRKRGIRLEMVLDEGGVIGDGLFPGVSAPVALVGIAEKGFLTLELHANTPGGHSSLPPRQSAVGILSAALARLEDQQLSATLTAPTRQLFERIGPEFPLPQRALFANLWLTEPLVVRNLEKAPTTNAMVRTTTAVTSFSAGEKDNLLPRHARATVNFRILPGESISQVESQVRRVIDDPRVTLTRSGQFSSEPSPVSSTNSAAFRSLERTLRRVHPEATVAPYLVVVATDARYFNPLSANVFRLLPIRLAAAELAAIHGINERISIENYAAAIRFYRDLMLEQQSTR